MIMDVDGPTSHEKPLELSAGVLTDVHWCDSYFSRPYLAALLARIEGVNNIFSNQCGISGLLGVLDEPYGAILCIFWLFY